MTSIRTISRICLALLLAAALTAAGPGALAGFAPAAAAATDKVILKDGTVIEGEIEQELDGYIWITVKVGAIEEERVLDPDEIDRIVRDSGASDPEPVKDDADPDTERATAPSKSGGGPEARSYAGPRGAVLSLGEGLSFGGRESGRDMVGLYVTAESLARARELLKEQDIDVVVLLVDSGGGLGLEVQRLSDEIHYNYKTNFHTVAWIDSAISAAAMAAHCLNEIYFKPNGTYGAATGFNGATMEAVSGIGLEEMLYEMEKISDRGGHDPEIMRAMQIMEPLSATILDSGKVEWYQSTEGEIMVNPEGKVLTFTANQAEKLNFSSGTAATLDQLQRLMGYSDIEWVGKQVEGVPYPVSKAEEYMREFRDQVQEDEERLGEYILQYNQAIGYAQQAPLEDRGKFVNKARQALRRIQKMVDNNSNFALLNFNMLPDEFEQWVREQEEMLRDLMK